MSKIGLCINFYSLNSEKLSKLIKQLEGIEFDDVTIIVPQVNEEEIIHENLDLKDLKYLANEL